MNINIIDKVLREFSKMFQTELMLRKIQKYLKNLNKVLTDFIKTSFNEMF